MLWVSEDYRLTPANVQVAVESKSWKWLPVKNVKIINKVTLSDILNENPSLSIRDAREQLMEENEHRDDLLQKCILARNSLLSGKPIPQSLTDHKEPPKKSPKKSKMASQKRISANISGSDKNSRVPSPNRSIRKGSKFIYNWNIWVKFTFSNFSKFEDQYDFVQLGFRWETTVHMYLHTWDMYWDIYIELTVTIPF